MYEKDGIKYYSPAEPFHFPKIDTRKLKRAHTDKFDYVCPHCKNIISIGFIASEEEYTINGKNIQFTATKISEERWTEHITIGKKSTVVLTATKSFI